MSNVDTAYMTFGRFNPPHMGHYGLINMMLLYAGKYNAHPYVFISLKEDHGKNPLTFNERHAIITGAFQDRKIINDNNSLVGVKSRTFLDALHSLDVSGYKYERVVFYLGKDRCDTFRDVARKYLKEFTNIKEVDSVCVPFVNSVHATYMRNWVRDGMFWEFRDHFMIDDVNLAKKYYNLIAERYEF